MFHDEAVAYGELYGITVDEYIDTPTTALPFSARVINRFMSNGITTVADLLRTTPAYLISLKGFGKTCLDEVEAYIAALQSSEHAANKIRALSEASNTHIKSFKDQIALGDFSFVEQGEWSEEKIKYIELLKEAFSVLGAEMVFDCIMSPEKVTPIIQMFDGFQNEMKPYIEIQKLLQAISPQRRNKKAIWYIKAFTINEEEREQLQTVCTSDTQTIAEMAARITPNNIQVFILAKKFLKWCRFDLRSEIEELFENLYKNERACTVIKLRAEGKTLEQIGNTLGVTRERVRQIEMKVKRTFARLHSRIRIVSKIAAERNGDTVLTPAEIAHYCERDTSEISYLLQSYEGTNYTYDKQLDVFIIGDDSLHDRVDTFLESLPNIVTTEQFKKYVNEAEEAEDIPNEMFEKAFFESYRQTGAVYHRSRLSLAMIYQDIMSKHYPNGIHAYDAEELKQFREYVYAEYGEVRLPTNNRALTARIARVCILCGRGRYRLKQKQYMPKALLEKIYTFICNEDAPVFLTGYLFNAFEEELVAAGVDNRYYLQGILHETFADELVFRRDYVSKDAEILSIYPAIVDFIKCSKYPISKLQIQKAFSGITDIVIALSVSDPEILNYFGEYFHASHLSIADSERNYLYGVVSKILSDGAAHHAKDFYEVIHREKPEVLTRNAVMYPFGMYSILEYLFREEFQFLRPYIALPGVEIGRPGERLHEFIYCTDSIAISDIREFAKENHFQIQSMIEYANMCNDEYLLIDRDTLMRIEKVGITAEDAAEIDSCVAQNISQTTPIHQLDIWGALPNLNVSWTDWLLYSVLNKWGKQVSAGTSSNQMKMAVPLVAPAGVLNTDEFRDLVASNQPTTIRLDDLDNVDELLEDIIGDDFWEEPYEP